MDYYNILRIPLDATAEEIRSAYFAAIRAYHPDVNPSPEAREIFIRVQEAYEVLSNPQRRATYDANIPPEYRQPPSVALEWTLSRNAIPRLNEPQLVYVMLDLKTTVFPDPVTAPPAHICLVVDRSTSMRGERIEMVRISIGRLIQKLRPNDLVSLIAFGDKAEILLNSIPVQNQIEILHTVNQIQVGGGTEILRGLETAINLVRFANHANNITAQIWLITDGHTYGDEQASIELATNAYQEGIVIHAFGIGKDWNDDFLDILAGIAGGAAHLIRDEEDLSRYFEQKGLNLKQLYAKNIEIDFVSEAGIALNYAFKVAEEAVVLPTASPLPIGDLYYSQGVKIIFEFLIPPMSIDTNNISLLQGKLLMEIPTLRVRFWRMPVSVNCEIKDEVEFTRLPDDLVKILAQLTLYRMQERARQEVTTGDISRASRRLHYLATHLMAKGKYALARSVLTESEHLQRTHHMSDDRAKHIKYGTRALLLPSGTEEE
ncbi:MAG: DnaJ domain-containing protein [Thermanaerothrix sp.]|uniref:DnaJ domain-containing protein n=1 Tax=Thermanaerothrix sp. TaxID=2972675 RepID=UPI003C7E71DA